MSDLFTSQIADQRPTGRWSTSILLHLVLILSLAILSLLKPRIGQGTLPRIILQRIYWLPDHETIRVPTPGDKNTPLSPPPAKIPVPNKPVIAKTVQPPSPQVKPAGLDPASARLAPQHPDMGKVILNNLRTDSTVGSQSAPVGPVQIAGVLDAVRPGRAGSQASSPEQHPLDRPARLHRVPDPVYTEEARRLNITGDLKLIVWLKANGEVQFDSFPSDKRLGHGLDEAAIDAVNQAQCEPAIKNGVPLDVKGAATVSFRLSSVR